MESLERLQRILSPSSKCRELNADEIFGMDWERAHFDFLSFFDDPAEGLKLDEAVKEVNHAITQIRTYLMNTEVWATELPHTSRMEPFGAVLIFRCKDRGVMSRHRRGRLKYPSPPLGWSLPLKPSVDRKWQRRRC